jgi:hypothetical protein
MVNSKQKFIDYVNLYIKRDGIQNVLAYLEQSDFYVAPASTMFHLNIEGGLCQHSINVFETALSIYQNTLRPFEESGQTNYDGATSLNTESIAVVCLLHDISKVGLYHKKEKWKKDEHNQWQSYIGYEVKDNMPLPHATKSIVMIQQFMKLTGHEMLAIEYHHSFSDISRVLDSTAKYSYTQALKISPLVTLVAQADMFATFLLEEIKEN